MNLIDAGITKRFNSEQPSNDKRSILSSPESRGTQNWDNKIQNSKEFWPMASTDCGRSNFRRDEHPIKEQVSICFRGEFGSKVTMVNDLQSRRQPYPKYSTDAGIIMLLSEEHRQNAYGSILRTLEPDSKEKFDKWEQPQKQLSGTTSTVFGI
jgi:hypothetical protein